MSLLIIGATGNLGRQIVKQALDEGYQVRCLVRNLRKAIFLREWGAELIYGDVCILETIPRCLYNISGVIDTFTARPFDTQKSIEIDLYSKIYLIHAAQVASVHRERLVSEKILNIYDKLYIPFLMKRFKHSDTILFSKIIMNVNASVDLYYLDICLFVNLRESKVINILNMGRLDLITKKDIYFHDN